MKLEDLAKHFNVEVHYGSCVPTPIGPPCPTCLSTETKPTTLEWELDEGDYTCESYQCAWCHTIFANDVKLKLISED